MALSTRNVAADPADSDAWLRAVSLGFQGSASLGEEELRKRREKQDLSRATGVFDGDRCVATYRSFDQRLTVPGGSSVSANAVSQVTVTATHRRRGLLSRLMAGDLAAARERGDVVATLIAAEYLIYGRFGFGPATTAVEWEANTVRAGLDARWSVPECGGSVEYADTAEILKLGPGLHERLLPSRAGLVDRPALWWERAAGEVRFGPEPWQEPYTVVYRDADGEPQGLALYTSDNRWTAGMPDNVVGVTDLLALIPAAERALWRFLLSIDWATTLRAGHRPPDDLLPLLLPDRRAATVRGQADFLWLRPLDTPAMLAARSYAAAGELVVEVSDPLGLAGGRFLLEASPEGAHCAPTGRAADLTLDVGALSSLYLGDAFAVPLARAGLVEEETRGAAARADLLFRTAERPWCPDMF